MSKPADHPARQAALDIQRSFIVKAPAGSGKTTLLVKRYLRLLATVENPEEIIAITFTRKAAAEMVGRVLKALGAGTAVGDDDIDEEMDAIAAGVIAHDRELGWRLTENPSRIRIQTIDSFSNGLVRQMPWNAGFGAAPAPASDDAQPMYEKAARKALLRMLSDQSLQNPAQKLLLELDNNFQRACDLLVTMLGRRDQWQSRLPVLLDQNTARSKLELAWKQVGEHILSVCSSLLETEEKQDLAACARYAAGILKDTNPDSGICVLVELEQFPDPDTGEIGVWRALAGFLLTKRKSAQSLRKTVNVKQGFPTPGKGGDPVMKKRMQDLLQRLDRPGVVEALADIRDFPPVAFSDREWVFVRSLVPVLTQVLAELRLEFQGQGACDHMEIAGRALMALGETEGPSDLALRLDYQVRHLLVDEFQDTSHSQIELIRRLTTGWQDGDGRTMFFVGDPMQSIYRFRQGDVGIFLEIFNHGFGQVRLDRLELVENFRSSSQIVNWVNLCFSQAFPGRDDPQFGAVSYAASNAFRSGFSQDAGVYAHRVDNDTEALEMLSLIRQLLEMTDREEQIAVLVRSRKHLEEIVAVLNHAEIPFQGVKLNKLSRRSIIQDMLALTRALIMPGDKLSWLAILRAPWCGTGLQELTQIAEQARDRTVWQVIQELPGEIGPQARTRLARIHKVLEAAVHDTGRIGLDVLVGRTWQALGGADVTDKAEHRNVRQYLQLLGDIQQAGRLSDPELLEQRIENLWDASAVDHRLKLMTMHTAKGLEFDHVVLPGLYRTTGNHTQELLSWHEYLDDDGRSSLLFAPIRLEDAENSKYAYVRQMIRRGDREESKRLLYVACTRAIRQLHLMVKESGNKSSLQQYLGDSINDRLQPVSVEPGQSAENEIDSGRVLARLPLEYPGPVAREKICLADTRDSEAAEVPYEWAGVWARHVGTLIHEIICDIARGRDVHSAENREQWRMRLLAMGVDPVRMQQAMQAVEAALVNLGKSDTAGWILDPGHSDAENEWALSARLAGRLENIVIDRTFTDETGRRWIIDYKTSTHEGGNMDRFLESELERYRPQLEKYAAIVRLQGPGPIQIGLYFPLLDRFRDWEYRE